MCFYDLQVHDACLQYNHGTRAASLIHLTGCGAGLNAAVTEVSEVDADSVLWQSQHAAGLKPFFHLSPWQPSCSHALPP